MRIELVCPWLTLGFLRGVRLYSFGGDLALGDRIFFIWHATQLGFVNCILLLPDKALVARFLLSLDIFSWDFDLALLPLPDFFESTLLST